jgi:hypothetical protein
VKDGDARDCGDVGIRASWGAADERAVIFALLFWNDQHGWIEDGRSVRERGQRREWYWGIGQVRARGPFGLHLRVFVAAVGEEAKWEGE